MLRGLNGCGEGWAVGFRSGRGRGVGRSWSRPASQSVEGKFRGRGDEGSAGGRVDAWRWVLLGMRDSSQFSELERGQWKMFSRC